MLFVTTNTDCVVQWKEKTEVTLHAVQCAVVKVDLKVFLQVKSFPFVDAVQSLVVRRTHHS